MNDVSLQTPGPRGREEPQAPDLLLMSVAGTTYAVEVRFVVGVFSKGHVTPVPYAPDCILGLVSLKSRIVPLVDLEALLRRAEPRRPSHRGSVVLLEWRDIQAGILADSVLGVRRLEENRFSQANGVPEEPIVGTVEIPEGRALLLNVGSLLTLVRRMAELVAQRLGYGGIE